MYNNQIVKLIAISFVGIFFATITTNEMMLYVKLLFKGSVSHFVCLLVLFAALLKLCHFFRNCFHAISIDTAT